MAVQMVDYSAVQRVACSAVMMVEQSADCSVAHWVALKVAC